MLALGLRQKSGRVILVEHNIAHQGGAAVDALEEIVAQQMIFRDASGQGAVEGVHIVDAFAHVDALTEEILVDVGDGQRVKIDARVAGKDAAEGRTRRRHRADLGARLQDSVAGGERAAGRVELGTVERMRQRPDQPLRAARRQFGVGVQGNHVADVAQRGGLPHHFDKGRRHVATQQAVELVELAPLALPAHPDAFGRVPEPAPVEEVKGLAACRAVTAIQRLHAVDGPGQ